MLIRTVRRGDCINIGNDISIVIIQRRGSRLVLGIKAPREIPIDFVSIEEECIDEKPTSIETTTT